MVQGRETYLKKIIVKRTGKSEGDLKSILSPWGTWVTQLVKHPTLDLGSDPDLRAGDQALCVGCGILSPSPSAPSDCDLPLKINK